MPAPRLALTSSILMALASPAAADEVRVSNFPDVQRVRGEVEVSGRVDATRFVSFPERVVPAGASPATPGYRDLVELGVVEARGHAALTASVAAWVPRTQPGRSAGAFGLILVPDLPIVMEALEKEGRPPLALTVEGVQPDADGTILVSSGRLGLPFPRWRAYLYNTTHTSLRVQAFAMLAD